MVIFILLIENFEFKFISRNMLDDQIYKYVIYDFYKTENNNNVYYDFFSNIGSI